MGSHREFRMAQSFGETTSTCVCTGLADEAGNQCAWTSSTGLIQGTHARGRTTPDDIDPVVNVLLAGKP